MTGSLVVHSPKGNAAPDERRPLSLEDVLRQAGPHFAGTPLDDAALFARLELAGQLAWRLPSAAQRELVVQQWLDALRETALLGIENPYWVVKAAFEHGRNGDTGLPATLPWITAEQLRDLPPTEELVRGVLPVGALAVLYGSRGLGKTFIALDLACTVDAGASWHAHHVRKGPVAYILAEGRGGLGRRLEAWKQHKGAKDPGVRFLCQTVRLLETRDVERLLNDLARWDPPPVLILLDTLARCMAPGDENSTADMGAVVSTIDRLRERTGAAVLALHHTGHDKTRERGSSALGAAADTVLSVTRDTDVLTLACEKQRDGPEFNPIRFRLHPVGESVVPERVHGGDGGLSEVERQCLEVLNEACVGNECVPSGKWHTLAEVPLRTFHRARNRLLTMALVETIEDGRYVRYRPRLTDNERT